jgi:hypothetical protein
MRLRVLGMACLLIALTGVRAQGIEVAVPPDRFTGPGEFVTLVFRLTAAEPVEVEVVAATEGGWPVLRQPGAVRLEVGRSTPVVATVEVPADATAFSEERVRLLVTTASGARLERVVVLTVTESIALDLVVPREVILGVEGLTVIAVNRGNAADDVTLELLRGADLLDRREFTLGPGAREELAFELRDEGNHVVVLTGSRGAEVRRVVTVVRFGTPEPEPRALSADVVFGTEANGGTRSTFTVEGALSDFVSLEARADGPGWRRSYAELRFEDGSLRLGGGWRDPFDLRLPATFGVAGTLRRGGLDLAATVGHVGGDRFAGAIAGSWSAPPLTLAVGAGVAEGAPVMALRADHDSGGLRVTATAGHARGASEAGVRLEAQDDQGAGELELRASGLTENGGQIDLRVKYGTAVDTLYGDARWSLDDAAPWTGRLGANVTLVSPLIRQLRLGLQGGSQESFLQLSHRADLGDGWRAANTAGMRWDAAGFGWTFDTSFSRFGSAYVAADARLVYRPTTGGVEGGVGVRAEADAAPWSINASGGWDLGGRTVGGSVGVDWRDGPWRVEVGGTASYGLASPPGERWDVRATLTGGYAFAIPVGSELSEAFGGRRVGVLEGRVAVDGEGLPGVVVEVGRYRVMTDDAGAFRLELPPGRYRWSVVVGSVPIAVRLSDEARGDAEVRLRETTTLEVRAVRTTVLVGRVLEDRDGDGVADEPAAGARGRLVVTDAEGLRRTVSTDAEGAFEVRGLVPGAVTVALVEVAGGATIVGDDATTLALEAGVPARALFLVQPAVVTVQSFTPQGLRIRSVEPESQRVPPGAAPFVRVGVQGGPDAVALLLPDGMEVALERDGDAWTARLPVPEAHAAGVFAFTVVARGPQGEATRRAQLVVDLGAPLLEITSDAPVRAGGVLRVRLRAYFDARRVSLAHPFGDDVALVEDEPGRWRGVLAVPVGTADAVYELVLRVEGSDDRAFVEAHRFRVLAP